MILDKYLKAVFGKSKIHILDAGNGGRRWLDVTNVLIQFADGKVSYLERNASRANAAAKRFGAKLNILDDRIEWFGSCQKFELVYIDLLPRQLPELFTQILPCAVEFLKQEGTLILNVPIGQSKHDISTTDSLQFEEFMKFAGVPAGIDSTKWVTAFKEAVQVKEIIEIEPQHTPAPNFEYKTFAFKVIGDSAGLPCSLHLKEPNHFRLNDLIGFLDRIRHQVRFCLPKEFISFILRGNDYRIGEVPHVIKHDIHHDLLSAYRLAKEEAKLHIRSAFFVMHPHALSQRYVDRSETIEVLLEIQALGHEIGVHVDGLELELSGPGLLSGLKPFVQHLRKMGLRIEAGNTHGNTKYQTHGDFGGNIILREVMASRTDKIPTIDGRDISGTVSLLEIADKLGLNIWFDTVIFKKGKPVAGHKLMIGDSYHRLDLYDLSDGITPTSTHLAKGENWRINDALQQSLINAIKYKPCVYLLHPQFYK